MEIPFGRYLAQTVPTWSICGNNAFRCILMPTRELLTTDEAADYLRLSERKLYELVADRAVPCSQVTGRWLFSRPALRRWVSRRSSPPRGSGTGAGAADRRRQS